MEKEFTKADLADFKRFWESEVGKKYIKKIKDTRKQLLQMAMGANERDQAFRAASIANGFDSILQDIEATIKTAEEKAKENKPEKKK